MGACFSKPEVREKEQLRASEPAAPACRSQEEPAACQEEPAEAPQTPAPEQAEGDAEPRPPEEASPSVRHGLEEQWWVPREALEFGVKLGNGGDAEVWEATLNGVERVAAKRLFYVSKPSVYFLYDATSVRELYDEGCVFFQAMKEIRCLARLPSHKNVVGFRGVVWESLHGEQVPGYILMDCVGDGKTLNGKRPESEAEFARMVRDLAAGLAHLHSQDVTHRDVKPLNALLDDDGSVKLGDLGFVKWYLQSVERPSGVKGTGIYSAPEYKQTLKAVPSVDVYSLGMTCFELLGLDAMSLEEPSRQIGQEGMSRVALKKEAQERYMRRAQELAAEHGDLGELLLRCLELRPRFRPSAEEIRKAAELCYQSHNSPALAGTTVEDVEAPAAQEVEAPAPAVEEVEGCRFPPAKEEPGREGTGLSGVAQSSCMCLSHCL